VHRVDQGVSPQAENYLADEASWGVLKAGCVNRGLFKETEHKRLPSDFVVDLNLKVEEGDVLASRASGSPQLVGSVGRIRTLHYHLILSDKTFRLRFKSLVDPDFMVLTMNSRYYRLQVERAISGAEGLANNLPLSALRAFVFAIPPLPEQEQIVLSLSDTTARLDTAIRRLEDEISLIHEYRTRLITDVITGQLDVRKAAASLPDELGEPDEMSVADGILEEADGADFEMDDLVEEVAE
jgi:type I restriction enzyme S subunit